MRTFRRIENAAVLMPASPHPVALYAPGVPIRQFIGKRFDDSLRGKALKAFYIIQSFFIFNTIKIYPMILYRIQNMPAYLDFILPSGSGRKALTASSKP